MQRSLPICPISQEPMSDPYITPCGHSFEKANIIKWVGDNHRCGLCQTAVTPSQLIPNLGLRDLIEQMKEMQKMFSLMQAEKERSDAQLKVIASADSKVALTPERTAALTLKASFGKSIQKTEDELAAKLFYRAIKRKRILNALQGEAKIIESKEEKKEIPLLLKARWDGLRVLNDKCKKLQIASVNTIATSMEATMTSLRKNPSDEKLIHTTCELAEKLKKEDAVYQERRRYIKEESTVMFTKTKPLLASIIEHRQKQREIKALSQKLKEAREQEIKYSQEQVETAVTKVSTISGLFGGTAIAPAKKLAVRKMDPEVQSKLNTAFCKAVASGNVSEAKSLLMTGAEVNSALNQDKKAMPALWTAIKKQDEPMVDLLLEHKINLNLTYPNATGWAVGESWVWDLAQDSHSTAIKVATLCHKSNSRIMDKMLRLGNIGVVAVTEALRCAVSNYDKDATQIVLSHNPVFDIQSILVAARRNNAKDGGVFDIKVAPCRILLESHVARPPATAPHPSSAPSAP